MTGPLLAATGASNSYVDTTGPYSSHCSMYNRAHDKAGLRRLSQLVLSGDRMQLEQSGLTTEGMVRALNRVAWAGKRSTCLSLGGQEVERMLSCAEVNCITFMFSLVWPIFIIL